MEIPTPDSYRLAADSITPGVCVARVLLLKDRDRRWMPAVYRESQCCGKVEDYAELGICNKHASQLVKFAETANFGAWNGLVTEEPPVWCHMLGTDWATDKHLKWLGDDAPSNKMMLCGIHLDVVCPHCRKTMRSDNFKRHLKTHGVVTVKAAIDVSRVKELLAAK